MKESVPARSRASVLFISLDGLTDPLGRSQVLPYLVGLGERGFSITILSLEKPERFRRDAAAIRQICERSGIAWAPLRYRRRPPLLSRMLNLRALERKAVALHRRAPFDLVHCRSYLPAMVGLALKRRFGVPFLFDMRGFWPDERVDGGIWPQSSPIYRRVYARVKRIEDELLREAGHIVSLTEAGKRQLLTRPQFQPSGPAISVIPCCVEIDHFPLIDQSARAAARAALAIPDAANVVAYLGSVGSWYLLDEMLGFFRVYLRHHPAAVMLFVTPDAPGPIIAQAASAGIAADRLAIRAASRDEVPRLMAAADLGLFFIKPCFSKIASSPTKLAELLALGLPIVTNSGVGDVAEIVRDTDCGVAIERFDDAAYEQAIIAVERPRSPASLRQAAGRLFDIDIAIVRYATVYRELAATTSRSTSTKRGA